MFFCGCVQRWAILVLGATLGLALTGRLAAQTHPASPVIQDIVWASPDSIIRAAKGSDNWPLTWADDDAMYSTYGDGWGFAPKVPKKLSMGFVRISGGPREFRGQNIRSDAEQYGDGRAGKKAWGILCVDATLYLWVGHADQRGGQTQFAWSRDHGRSWTFADWRFEQFGLVGFVNFGRNYEAARDDYVYAYSHNGPRADTPADGFILMRSPKERLADRASWEFFQGTDDVGQPAWTYDIRKRKHVVHCPGAALRSAMTFNSGLKRYLWWQQTPMAAGHRDRGDTRFEGGFTIMDAPEPWGPWTVAYRTQKWDVGPGEHADFPSKWISDDGKTVHLVFSGDDHFCVRRGQIKIRAPRN